MQLGNLKRILMRLKKFNNLNFGIKFQWDKFDKK